MKIKLQINFFHGVKLKDPKLNMWNLNNDEDVPGINAMESRATKSFSEMDYNKQSNKCLKHL